MSKPSNTSRFLATSPAIAFKKLNMKISPCLRKAYVANTARGWVFMFILLNIPALLNILYAFRGKKRFALSL